MPLYPYRCTSCGYRFEKIQSFSAEPETVCPNCGKTALERMLTAPALQFKGAGWYVNDYSGKSSSSDSAASGTADSKPSTESAKPAATESSPKPAAEPAPKPATPAASS